MKIVTKRSEDRLQVKQVELREPLVGDFIEAERLAGAANGSAYAVALLSIIGTFDGKKLCPEELHRLGTADFFALAKEFDSFGLSDVAKALSSSAEKEE